jgi:ABC-type histidine transport system ATPase subunit
LKGVASLAEVCLQASLRGVEIVSFLGKSGYGFLLCVNCPTESSKGTVTVIGLRLIAFKGGLDGAVLVRELVALFRELVLF